MVDCAMQVGQSSDFWNNFEIDIKLAQDIGMYYWLVNPMFCLYIQMNARQSRTEMRFPNLQAAIAFESP